MIANGSVMVIGGNEEKRASLASLLREFVQRAGDAAARIVIIPSASEEPAVSAERYARLFAELGAGHVFTVHAERPVTPDQLLLLANATGIFVTGGDQEQLMRHLRRSGCAEVIVEAVGRGAIYCGTSAGAAAASKVMLFGRSENGREFVEFAEGLGLLPTVIIDQHFSERRRLPRLLQAVGKHGLMGVGIDENTAAIWEAGRALLVRGASTVTIVEPANAVPRVLEHGEVFCFDRLTIAR
jgi:cyanophycinase